MTTASLSLIIHLFLKGLNKKACFRNLGQTFVFSTIYLLFRKLRFNQSHLRTHLVKKHPPPGDICVDDPFIQTLVHLNNAFLESPDPVSDFQYHFQADFFKNKVLPVYID